MKLHHIRNATFIIESKDRYILIDPMLSKKGELPPFSVLKHKAQKNPIVDLPSGTSTLLDKVTHALITHSQTFGIKALQHTDHLDIKGEEFLKSQNIPVVTVKKDEEYLKKYDLNVVDAIEYWEEKSFLDGKIVSIPAKHGHGWIHKLMANGAGYFIDLLDEPSIYICGDTVLTADVKKAIKEFQPDIVVVAAGNASLDIGQALLMNIDEVIELVNLAPNKVVANHMEALNHCGVTRDILALRLKDEGLFDKVFIPNDGDMIKL